MGSITPENLPHIMERKKCEGCDEYDCICPYELYYDTAYEACEWCGVYDCTLSSCARNIKREEDVYSRWYDQYNLHGCGESFPDDGPDPYDDYDEKSDDDPSNDCRNVKRAR